MSAPRRSTSRGRFSALTELIRSGEELVRFYPEHIVKEDKHFFLPVMQYFTQEEQDNMLDEFNRFDQTLIHDKYRGIVEGLEKVASGLSRYAARFAVTFTIPSRATQSMESNRGRHLRNCLINGSARVAVPARMSSYGFPDSVPCRVMAPLAFCNKVNGG